jgi:flagellar biosynthesis/type III secretory pathway M-ring protein FliF/YscJ
MAEWEHAGLYPLIQGGLIGLALIFLILGVLRPLALRLTGQVRVEYGSKRKRRDQKKTRETPAPAPPAPVGKGEAPALQAEFRALPSSRGSAAGSSEPRATAGVPAVMANPPREGEWLEKEPEPPEEWETATSAPKGHEKRVELVKRAIDEDPKRVAQVIKNWMNVDG